MALQTVQAANIAEVEQTSQLTLVVHESKPTLVDSRTAEAFKALEARMAAAPVWDRFKEGVIERMWGEQEYIASLIAKHKADSDFDLNPTEFEAMLDMHWQRCDPDIRSKVYASPRNALFQVTDRTHRCWPVLRGGDILEVELSDFCVFPGSIVFVFVENCYGLLGIEPKIVLPD